jgi:hypothetical protein
MNEIPIFSIRTGNPEKETWRYLQLFSKESYVGKLVKEDAPKNQIIACISQAAEIYNVSKSASILTKPILLFYGMQRLAKALIFLRNPNVNLHDLRTHGLSGSGISDDAEKFLDNNITKAKTGIFSEFAELAIKNTILLNKIVYEEKDYHYTEHWVHICNFQNLDDVSSFTIYDLFSLIPELDSLFYSFKMQNNMLISCNFSFRQHPNHKIDSLLTLLKKLDVTTLKSKFPVLEKYNLVNEEPSHYVMERSMQDDIEMPNRMVQAETKNIFLICPTDESNTLSDLRVHYILMFFLCHVARYKAPLWKKIIEGTTHSANIALVEKFIEVSESKFPKLILDELSNQYITYMSQD